MLGVMVIYDNLLQKVKSRKPKFFYIVFKNFAKFTMTSTQVYFCEFCNIFKNIFLIEYLETNASGMSRIYYLANLIHLKRI